MSFRWKLTLLSTAILLAALATITYQFLLDLRKVANDQNRTNIALALKFFETAVKDPLLAFDFAELADLTETLAAQGGVLFVGIYDADGREIAVAGDPGPRSGLARIGPDPVVHFEGARVVGTVEIRGITRPIGAIRLDMSTASVDTTTEHLSQAGLTNVALAALLVVSALTLALRPMMRGIDALTQGAERVAQGDLTGRVPVIGKDEIAAAAVCFNQMTEALIRERRALEIQANTDTLTGLPNRNGLSLHIEDACERSPDGDRVLIHLDLDNFKPINDTLGHKAGDAVLKVVSRRISGAIGKSGIIARFGGDEFVAFCEMKSIEAATRLSEKIIAAVSEPIQLGTAQLNIGASAGIALLPAGADARAVEAAISNADIALYASKAQGRGRATVFDQGMRIRLEIETRILSDATSGVSRGEFVPFFQPQIALATGEVTGFECLMRWNHPEFGLQAPEQFLCSLHDGTLLAAIDAEMRGQACAWLAAEIASGRLGPETQLGINVTQSQLRDPKIAETLLDLVFAHGLDPGNLAVEILESVIFDRADDPALVTLQRLEKAGFNIELDDFGTGYSSLEKLVSFEVDRIKIDRAFVTGARQDKNRRLVLEAVIGIGRALGIEVLAEGAETEADLRLLKDLGCTTVQGYAVAHPMPAEVASDWLARRQPAPEMEEDHDRTKADRSA